MVLYANSSPDDTDQDGALLWVDRDGGFHHSDTEGLYLGTVARHGDAVEFADTKYLYRVDAGSTRRVEHGRNFDMGHETVAVHTGPVHVFNSGIDPADGDYMWDFASIRGDAPASFQIKGELLGVGACGGQVYTLTGPWLAADEGGRQAVLSAVRPSSAGLASHRLGETSLSSRDGYWMGCRDRKLLVGAEGARRSRVYEVDPGAVGRERIVLNVKSDREITSHCGVIGQKAYSWAYDSSALLIDDLVTGTRHTQPVEGLTDDAACSVQGASVALSNRSNDGELRVYEVDVETGDVRSATVVGAADFLEDRGLVTLTAPVLLPYV